MQSHNKISVEILFASAASILNITISNISNSKGTLKLCHTSKQNKVIYIMHMKFGVYECGNTQYWQKCMLAYIYYTSFYNTHIYMHMHGKVNGQVKIKIIA